MDIILTAAQGAGKTRLAWTIARHMGLARSTAELTPVQHEYDRKGTVASQIIECRCDFVIIDLIGDTLIDAKREVEAARSRLNRKIVAVYCSQHWVIPPAPVGVEINPDKVDKGIIQRMREAMGTSSTLIFPEFTNPYLPEYYADAIRVAKPEEGQPTSVVDLETGYRFELPLLDDTAAFYYGKDFNSLGLNSRDFVVQQLVYRQHAYHADGNPPVKRPVEYPLQGCVSVEDSLKDLAKTDPEGAQAIFENIKASDELTVFNQDIGSKPDVQIEIPADEQDAEDERVASSVPVNPKGRTHQILLDICRNILARGKDHDRDAVMEAYKFYGADSLDGVAPKDYHLLHEHLIKINYRVDGYMTITKMVKKGRAPEVKALLNELGVDKWHNISLEQATDTYHKLNAIYFNGK